MALLLYTFVTTEPDKDDYDAITCLTTLTTLCTIAKQNFISRAVFITHCYVYIFFESLSVCLTKSLIISR